MYESVARPIVSLAINNEPSFAFSNVWTYAPPLITEFATADTSICSVWLDDFPTSRVIVVSVVAVILTAVL